MRWTISALLLTGLTNSVFAVPLNIGSKLSNELRRFNGTLRTPSKPQGRAVSGLSYDFMTVTVGVGSPPQNQTLTFDTGSWFFFVFGGNNSGLYDVSASRTFTNLTKAFNPGFAGDNGYWASETVNIGGFNVSGAEIGIVNGSGHAQGGAMGFSPPDGTNPAYNGTWTAQLASVLESPVAGLNIYQNSEGPITFGYLDSTQYTGDLTWIPVNTTTSPYWNAATVYYSLDGVSTNASAGLPTIMDTGGTVFLSLDKGIVKEYYSKVPSAKDISDKGDATAWQVNCNETMPNLGLSFGSGPNGVDKPTAEILYDRLINYSSNTNGTCQAYLNAGQSQSLSRSFFLSNYVALDFTVGASRLGVAPKAHYEVVNRS